MSLSDHATPQLRQYILAHFLSAVNAVDIESSPFPHFFVRPFFPEDVYSELLDLLPPEHAYQPVDYNKHAAVTGQSNRQRFELSRAPLDLFPSKQRSILGATRSALASEELKQLVYSKFRSGLAYRFRCAAQQVPSLPGFALPELYRETSGYRIPPHPDTRKKIVTMQIALARDESQAHLGTEFYRRSFQPSAWTRDPKGFEVVKTMPFLPNAAYAFTVLNTLRVKSWHGRSRLPESSRVRDSILNIWYSRAQKSHSNTRVEHEEDQNSRAAA